MLVIFFGYTQCPDVCPTTMADTGRHDAKSWGRRPTGCRSCSPRVDPERDTQAVAGQNTCPAFDKRFVGLRGDARRRPRRWPRNSRSTTRRCRAPRRTTTRSTTRPAAMCSTSAGHLRLFVRHGQGIGQHRPRHPPVIILIPQVSLVTAFHGSTASGSELRTARRRRCSCWSAACCLFVLRPFPARDPVRRPPSSSRRGRCTRNCCATCKAGATVAALTMTLSSCTLLVIVPLSAPGLEPGR